MRRSGHRSTSPERTDHVWQWSVPMSWVVLTPMMFNPGEDDDWTVQLWMQSGHDSADFWFWDV